MKKVLLILLALSFSLQANTIYVNQEAKAKGADGKAWNTAYRNLNKALNLAKNGDDIWLAKGEYILKPTRLNGVNIYGGFSSTETELSQRDIVNNETKVFGRLALQNALLSSVTVLEEPERHRVVEINFNDKQKRTSFMPDRQRMQAERDRRDKEDRRAQRQREKREAEEVKSSEPSIENKPRESQRDRRGPPRPQEIMQKFDTNSDGKISKEEAPYRMKADWDRLDKNRDGFVEEKEITPPQSKDGQKPHRQERR